MTNTSLVSVHWLMKNRSDENIIILDCTLPNQLAKMPITIQSIQIENARFFDIKRKFSDTSNEFPTAYPSKDQFEKECQNLGINNESRIVVYDANGIYSSPRVWWLFKSMGHENVFVLNGGLPEWIHNDFPVEKKNNQFFSKGNFTANSNPHLVRKFEDIFSNLDSKNELIIDVRSKDRFEGIVPEPREGLRSGKIPNSINFPYLQVLKNGKFKDRDALVEIFKPLASIKQPMVFSCGSGITACVVLLASETILKNHKAVYDGSWTEWGAKTKA